jgi:hypothetical protein
VETNFILITSWNFKSYRIPQFCDNFMELQPKRTRVWPRPMYRYGMFMHIPLACLSFLMAMCSPSLFGARYAIGRSLAMG